MKNFLLACCVLGLAGCTAPYKIPETNNLANVRFYAPETSKMFHTVGVYALTDENCGGATKLRQLGARQIGGLRDDQVDIGMIKGPKIEYDKNVYVEVPVIAGKRFNFTMYGAHNASECKMTASFLPMNMKQYEVEYFTDGGSCYVVVSELLLKDGSLEKIKEQSFRKNEKTCSFFWN